MDDKYLGMENTKYERFKWDDSVEMKLSHTCDGIGKSGISKGKRCGKQAFFKIDEGYYCRIHDPMKKTRLESEKYQRQDVSYDYTVVQVGPNGENRGVLPAMLDELYTERKKVKKQMAKARADGDENLYSILDGTQLAVKVSLNSAYGALGRRQGNLILKELASIVTSVGRQLIVQSKQYSENEFVECAKNNGLLTHKIEPVDVSTVDVDKELSKFLIK